MSNDETENSKPVAAAPPAKKLGLFTRVKKIKHLEIIIAGIAVVVMLAIYFTSRAASASAGSAATAPVENYCQKIERELNEKLSALSGAGNVEVLVSWESGIEAIIAYTTNSNNNSVSQTPQIISGGGTQSPIVLKEIYPKALGVVILCQGADNVRVKLDIINSVATLLDIGPGKIHVLPMTK